MNMITHSIKMISLVNWWIALAHPYGRISTGGEVPFHVNISVIDMVIDMVEIRYNEHFD